MCPVLVNSRELLICNSFLKVLKQMFAGGKNVLTVIEQSYFHQFGNSTLFELRVWILIPDTPRVSELSTEFIIFFHA